MTGMEMEIRRATEADAPAILELLHLAMGDDLGEHEDALFRWKHDENAFGASPRWVAVADGRIVGLRVFLRWTWERDGELVTAVRAVDTATHPDFQGKGIFTKLTLGALDDLRAEGVQFVFNTPNDKSRPGYMKMGWSDVGRLRAWIRPRTVGAPLKMARSRVPAERWSQPCTGGLDATAVLADATGLEKLLASQNPTAPGHLRTARTPAFLKWRYGFAPLAYRAVTGEGGVQDGVAIWRNRCRGAALEAALANVIVPEEDDATARSLLNKALRASGADYGIVIARRAPGTTWLPLPGGGPDFTYRAVASVEPAPPLEAWNVSLGDIELF